MTTDLPREDAGSRGAAASDVAVVGSRQPGSLVGLEPARLGDRRPGLRARRRSRGHRRSPTASTRPTSTGANEADVVCILVPDDVIPMLPLAPRDDALTIVASGGYGYAFERSRPGRRRAITRAADARARVRLCYQGR